jgi:hypothetical protein
MYVTSVPNRGSPPAVLLRESYRDEGKVKTRTLANLSHWPEHKVETLKRALKDLPPAVDLSEAFEITRSLPHGHVAAVLGTVRRLGIAELIDPAPSRRRDLVTAMLVAQVIAPGSKLATAPGRVRHLCRREDLHPGPRPQARHHTPGTAPAGARRGGVLPRRRARLPGRLGCAPRQGVRPLRSHHRHRPLRPSRRPGHDH